MRSIKWLFAVLILFALNGDIQSPIDSFFIESMVQTYGYDGYVYTRDFLTENKDFRSISTKSFRAIALSNAAEGLSKYAQKNSEMKDEISDLFNIILETYLSSMVSPNNQPMHCIEDFENQGLYLSHLNVILGVRQKTIMDDAYFHLNARLSEVLAERSISDPQKHVPSFDTAHKFPADQAVTLYSLWLFDQNYCKSLSQEAIDQWLSYLDNRATDKKTGLPYSEVSGTASGKHPRGCALSWSIYYMSFFCPDKAAELWERYKEHFWVNLGPLGGFREWPKGIELSPDIDSGPIVMGIGGAATALGIRAAYHMNDWIIYVKLLRVDRSVDKIHSHIKSDSPLGKNILTESFRFNLH